MVDPVKEYSGRNPFDFNPKNQRESQAALQLAELYGLTILNDRYGENNFSNWQEFLYQSQQFFVPESREWLKSLSLTAADWLDNSKYDGRKALDARLLLAFHLNKLGEVQSAKNLLTSIAEKLSGGGRKYDKSYWSKLAMVSDYLNVSLPQQATAYIASQKILSSKEEAVLIDRLAKTNTGDSNKLSVLKALKKLAEQSGQSKDVEYYNVRIIQQTEAAEKLGVL